MITRFTFSATGYWSFNSSEATITGTGLQLTSLLESSTVFYTSFFNGFQLEVPDNRQPKTIFTAYPTEINATSHYVQLASHATIQRGIEYSQDSGTLPTDLDKGCMRLCVTPLWSTKPQRQENLMGIYPGGVLGAQLYCYFDSDAKLYYRIYNTAGGLVLNQNFGVPGITSGCQYTFELNWQLSACSIQTCYINGCSITTVKTSACSHLDLTAANTGTIRLYYGSPVDIGPKIHFFQILSELQHTASYTFTSSTHPHTHYCVNGNMFIESCNAVTATTFNNFWADMSIPSSTRFVFKKNDGLYYYYDSVTACAWITSNKAFEYANDELTVSYNISAITNSSDIIRPCIVIKSLGYENPIVREVQLDYIGGVNTINECVISFYVNDLLGVELTSGNLYVHNDISFWHSDKLILPFKKSATITTAGYITISVIETETVSQTLDFELNYTDPNTNALKKIRWSNKIVPDIATKDGYDVLGEPD